MNSNPNSNSYAIYSNTERMTSIIIDIEAQNESKEESKEEIQLPLKGILKKTDENSDHDRVVQFIVLRLCLPLLIIILMSPIIICDLYFGFTDTSCSREQPDELAISLKLYLIVSGLVGGSTMIMILTTIILFEHNTNSELALCIMSCGTMGISCITMGVSMFHLIWNILGAVVFWGYIYGNGNCDRTFSTYVFVSLIIKFVSTLVVSQSNKKNDRN